MINVTATNIFNAPFMNLKEIINNADSSIPVKPVYSIKFDVPVYILEISITKQDNDVYELFVKIGCVAGTVKKSKQMAQKIMDALIDSSDTLEDYNMIQMGRIESRRYIVIKSEASRQYVEELNVKYAVI